jgi:general secretion pathway protein M
MTLRDRFEALAPREKRLLGILAGVAGVLLLAAIPIGVMTLLGDAEATNLELQEAIERIEEEGEGVRERQAERDAILRRYETPVAALPGFLDKAAQGAGITIPESKEPSPVAHGKKFEERFTSLSLRKVGLLALVKFMEKVSGTAEPISISKLNIRKRGAEPDAYDVQMTVSAYHRIAPKEKAAELTKEEADKELEDQLKEEGLEDDQ